MKLDDRMPRLIAVGAAIAANRQQRLDVNFTKALKNGANEQEIAEEIEIGKTVRQGAAFKRSVKMACLANLLPVARPAVAMSRAVLFS